MKSIRRQKGPWTHRALVYLFTSLFGLLAFWLLGFVVRDIATWPGPDYRQFEEKLQDPALLKESESLQTSIDDASRAISLRKERQQVLRDSTSNSEKTMNQLLELQKLTLQKGVTPSAEEVQALAESQKLFLQNQSRYQEINDEIAKLSEQLSDLQNRQRAVRKSLDSTRPTIQQQYQQAQSSHQWKLAALKLAVLVPLLALAVWLLLKKRGSLYAPLMYGFGLAVAAKVVLVMHEHFPRRYFKYVLIVVALLLVARVLAYLLRTLAHPKIELLLKQYREAYERFLCPVCGYPIRRGPLTHLFWTRGSIKKLNIPAQAQKAAEEPYVCPVCSTRLFEACSACRGIRHSLLPTCTHCGDEREVQASTGAPVSATKA